MGVSVNYARRSIATIDSPEFVNITSISPLVSKCEVKVLYVGENRNRSFISKEVAAEMAQTLPGCPIVGYYIENKEDFGDHGDQVIIDGEGIKFKKLTKPYGFVAPDAKVWFQKFEDTDEFGNTVIREYLMTEGFLWTGQFEECQRVVDQGNPQSMELDEKTLKGHWSTNTNKGIDFFIINDAIFSKLCILGEDVEPCFEGSSVTAPDVSSNFSKDDNFMQSLFTMMETLKFTLSNKEGEQSMENQNTVVAEVENQDTTPIVEENFSAVQDKVNEETSVENQNITEEPSQDSVLADDTSFAKKDDEEDDKKDNEDENKEDKKDEANDNDDDEEDTKKKYELLVAAHEELQAKYSELETSYQALVEFKNQVEDKEKDDLIASFVMLSDEDKKEVIKNKSKYSLREIKAELSMICVDKKVSFDLNKEEDNEDELPLTYNLNSQETSTLPAWLQAVEDTRKRMK